jgi:hypothetical protein
MYKHGIMVPEHKVAIGYIPSLRSLKTKSLHGERTQYEMGKIPQTPSSTPPPCI